MKNFKFICSGIFFIVLLLSCTSEDSGIDQDLKSELISQKGVQILSSNCDCGGDKKNLPVVIAQHFNKYSTTPGTLVTWSGAGSEYSRNYYTLTISGCTNWQQRITNSGSHFFATRDTSYIFNFSISCGNNCVQYTESLVVYGDSACIGRPGNCNRTYLSYVLKASKYGGGMTLYNQSPEYIRNNKRDYIDVNSYEIYQIRYMQAPYLMTKGSIIPEKTTINYPFDSVSNYEIRFYNSFCPKPNEHYLYGPYGQGECTLAERKHSGVFSY